jgi:hypothetical protein
MSGLLGFLNATMSTIPYAALGIATSDELSGLMIGVLNTVQVVSQILSQPAAGEVMSLSGSTGIGLAFSGLFAVIGCFVSFWIIVPHADPVPVLIEALDEQNTGVVVNADA